MKLSKAILLGFIYVFYSSISIGQNLERKAKKTQTFVNMGMSKPFLMSGNELMRSQDIRKKNLSYYENTGGERKDVGSYSGLIGWNLGLGFYHPINNNKLMWGSEVNMNLTGSTPSAGYEEAYYFNSVSLNFGLKSYFITNQNLHLKVNGGFASVMTKNRFINGLNEQNFMHQFGIGINGAATLGYTFDLNTKILSAFEIALDYKISSVRVEVNGVGNDKWIYSGLDFKMGLLF